MTSPYAAVRSTFPLAPVSVALPRPGNCAWVEPLKGLALLWIFLNHITESLFGPPYFGNPDQNWPVLSVRLAQILPSSASLGSILFALLKDFGWLGDQGVTLFLVVSGFGLTWGQLGRSSPPDWLAFYRRRLRRIYPLWIAAHLCLLLPPAFFALHISVLDSALWLSLLGIRITPRQLYYGYSSWWYIPLLLQLYLVFPLIWIATRSRQIRFRMAGLILSALALRTCGLLYFQGYLDAWSRGAVFLARLPEFLLGVLLAQILFRFDLATLSKLVRLALGAASLFILAVALWCSLSKVGMGFAPFLFGAGLLGVYLPFFAPTKLSSLPPLGWLGRHSLALLLVHQLWLRLCLKPGSLAHGPARFFFAIALFGAATCASGLAIECVASRLLAGLHRLQTADRRLAFGWSLAAPALLVWCLGICVELGIRKLHPFEPPDLGWGERPSLQPDSALGWKLIPNRTTELQWETYKYVVQANSLGFPGPLYSEARRPEVPRMLVTGDAFTSAEGVTTSQAWPRRLEQILQHDQPHEPFEVMNFAITGFGPNQYAAVVHAFAPRYRPDLIVIASFVNDFGDVTVSDSEFRHSIGFENPDPAGLPGILTLRHVAAGARQFALRYGFQTLLHRPDPAGYFWGQFHFLEAQNPDLSSRPAALFAEQLGSIKTDAEKIHAKLVLLSIPAAPQVCQPAELKYWPRYIDLSDTGKFDLDGPQRATTLICARLGIPVIDLREALRSPSGCPYQPWNMHWTAQGHQLVADYLARNLPI